MHTRPLPLIAAGVLLTVLTACGEDPDPATEAADAAAEASEPTTTGDTAECIYPEAAFGAAGEVSPPPEQAPAEGEVEVTLTTTVGDLELALDAGSTPCTVNSFVSLVEQGWLDDTECHRLTTRGIFVLQCGDPTATGTGGPGYSFSDELTGDETYPAGTLAMANSGPDTNGSQFFVVYEDSQLPPLYTVFGRVDDDSLALVQKVARKGTDEANGPGDGAPRVPVAIEQAEVA